MRRLLLTIALASIASVGGAAAGEGGSPAEWLERYRVLGDNEALDQCLEDTATTYAARLARARCLLSAAKTNEALKLAEALNREAPDELDAYALLVEAHLSIGQVDQAEKAAQWMLDLRTSDVRSLSAAALVREQAGDTEGAIDLLVDCYRRTPPNKPLDRAELLKRLSAQLKKSGRTADAEQTMATCKQLLAQLREQMNLRNVK